MREGLTRQYYDNGQIGFEGEFKNGELVSQLCWNEAGKKTDCTE